MSDGHTDGSQPAGNTVDLATEYTKNIGVVELVTYWEHPDTDPEPPALPPCPGAPDPDAPLRDRGSCSHA